MIEYPNKLDEIFDKLHKYKVKPVIVGGYVRDYFLNSTSKNKKFITKDIDIELYNADTFENIQKLLSEFGKSNIIGKSFGVIKLNIDDLEIDFSLPRTENKIAAGHKGFLVHTNSNLDYKSASSRRDFTINSIGYDIFNKKIIDPHNGLKDLKSRTLKIVSENSFIEDPLRVLRAMQFCARFDFIPDKQLIDISKTMCQNNLLEELPKERIFEEFKKLFLKSLKPSIGLRFLKNVDAFIFFHELNMPKNNWLILLQQIDNLDKSILDNNTNVTIMLALLCYSMNKTDRDSFINKLTNNKSILRDINSLYHIDIFLNTNITIKYTIAKDINIDMLISYLNAKNISKKSIDKIEKIKPIIHGKNLLDVGFKPSSDFSKILQLLYEIQINNMFN